MGNIYFEPWIGDDYWDGGIFGTKILVIGNSHYCKSRDDCSNCGIDGGCFEYEECSNFTSSVVNDYLNRSYWQRWMGTFQKFERALYGNYTDEDDSRRIWNSIAFYNYLQTAVPEWNDSGYDEDYNNSEDSFWEVLEELRPDYIIMWGGRVWDMSPSYNGDDCYELEDGTSIPLLGIHHPSWRFFNWEDENKKITSFLDDEDNNDSDYDSYDDNENSYDEDNDDNDTDSGDCDDEDENYDKSDESYNEGDDLNDSDDDINNSSRNSSSNISSIVLPLILSWKKK